MRGNKLVVSRTITTSRLDAPRSIDERVREFIESNATISLYPFSPGFSVKAAMPASADNKERRKKATGKNKRYGMGMFDPEAKRKPGQFFYPYPRQYGRAVSGGDKPNMGWLSPLRTVKPKDIYASTRTVVAQRSAQPQVIVRSGKKNPRTGTIDTKALGRSIGSMGRSISQAAARAIGIVIDANGRFRCPPKVPAANQFTDSVGSNCFDFNPEVGRLLVASAQNSFEELRGQVSEIDTLVPTLRDSDGSLKLKVPGVEILGPDGLPINRPGAPQTILGPDGQPISHLYPDISPEQYRSEVINAIREAHPDWSNEKVGEYADIAEQRVKMYDKTRETIQTALDYMSELGIDYDENNPSSMQVALAKSLFSLVESGWDLDLSNFFQMSDDFTGNQLPANSRNVKEAVQRHNESIIMSIFAVVAERYRIGEEGFDEAEKFVKWYEKKLKNNPRYDAELSARILTAIQNGDSPSIFKDVFERELYEKAAIRYRQYQSTEIGFMLGLLSQHKQDKELTEQVKTLAIASPFDADGMVDYESLKWNAQADVDDKGLRLVWNPIGMMATQPPTSFSIGQFRLFETNDMGTEVARLKAISEAVSETSRREMLDQYLGELRDISNDLGEIRRGNEYNEEFIRKNMGRVAQGIFVNAHEYVHVEQLSKLAYSLTHSTEGRDMGKMTNAEALEMAMDILTGRNDFLTLGDVMQDSNVWKGAISNLPDIMKVVLDGNYGGRYAKDEYYKAAILHDIVSRGTPQERYSAVREHYNEMLELQSTGFGDTPYSQALRSVYKNYLVGPDGEYVDLNDETVLNGFKRHNALTLTELQAELGAAEKLGLIDRTPEVDAILSPLESATLIPSQQTRTALLSQKPKRQRRYTLRGVVGSAENEPQGGFGYIPDAEYDQQITGDALKDTVRLSNRSSASRWARSKREQVLSNATPEQRKIAESQWRNAEWTSMPDDFNSVSMMLISGSGPKALDQIIDTQIIPFAELVESSILDESVAIEMHVPSGQIGAPGLDIGGNTLNINSYFTGVIKTDEDLELVETYDLANYDRVIVSVPSGMSGLPDYTPGTQKGEIGALALPPSTVEIIGRRSDGTVLGRVISQKSPEQALSGMESALKEIAESNSAPLSLRVDANKALRKIELRKRTAPMQSAASIEPTETESNRPRVDTPTGLRSARVTEQILDPFGDTGNDPFADTVSDIVPPRISRREQRRLRRIAERNESIEARSTEEKISRGPQNLNFGRDWRGVLRVADIPELERRFGDSASKHRAYFRNLYGIKISGQIPEDDIEKNGYYGTLQAIDDIFGNLDIKNIMDGDNLKIYIGRGLWSDDPFAAGSFAMSFRSTLLPSIKKQKPRILINTHKASFKSWDLWQEMKQVGLERFRRRTNFGSTLQMFANSEELEKPGGIDDETAAAAISKRMAYAISVHELAHFLDYKAQVNSEGRLSLRDVRNRGIDLLDALSISAGLSEQFAKFPAVSQYGTTSPAEKMAEAFTAWWLFSGSNFGKEFQISPQMSAADGEAYSISQESVLDVAEPIARTLLDRLGGSIKSAEEEDIPPVVELYAVLPFIIIGEDEK